MPNLFSFYYEWVLVFAKCFFCIYQADHVVFVLYFINMVHYINFQMLGHLCIPGINLMWSWCLILFIFFWILLNLLLRIFASMFMKDIGLKFSCDGFVWLSYETTIGL